MHVLVNMIFGSHLYGTETPSSDTDYKGVYLPTLREVVIGGYPKSINSMTKKGGTSSDEKNSSEDVDTEIYSLQRFLELGYMGETVFLDMIHNRHTILETSPEREFLYQNRSKFYTSDMKAYIGYCKAQAAKYGIKGSRIKDLRSLLTLFDLQKPGTKLTDIWEEVEETENITKTIVQNHVNGDPRFLDVNGKMLQASAKIEGYLPGLRKFLDNYGKRAELAASNEGVDWKAVSHAFRAGYQLIEIYETGDLNYPLQQAEYLRDIKQGKLHFVNDNIAQQLDDIVTKCYTLAESCGLSARVDRTLFEDRLVGLFQGTGPRTR